MAGSEEIAIDPFLGPGRRPVPMQRRAPRAPGDADDLETRGRARVDQVARLAVVPQDRVQAAAGLEHQPEPVLAGVGIFPADQPLAGPGRIGGPEDDEQAAVRRAPGAGAPAGPGRRTGAPSWYAR